MPYIEKILILLLLLAAPSLLYAQVTTIRGCSNNSNNDVYYIKSSSQGYSYTNYTVPSLLFDPSLTTCPRFTGAYSVAGSGRCCINGNCGVANVLYDLDYMQSCPLDESTPILLSLSCGLGFFCIRKLKLS